MKHLRIIGTIWLLIAATAVLFAANGIRMDHLSRDPAQVVNFPVYIGLLSNFGIIMWCFAAAISLYTAANIQRTNGVTTASSFLASIGMISVILLVDDLFLVHDVIFPTYFHIPEMAIYAFYLWVIIHTYRRYSAFIHHHTEHAILMLSVMLTGISVIIDIDIFPGGIDVEDTFKLFGIASYSYYCVITSGRLLAESSEPNQFIHKRRIDANH